MFRSLGAFIQELERSGELRRIREPVSPILEIARAADAESKSPAPNPPSAAARANDPARAPFGGQALLYEQVEGCDFPLLINAYGSYRRAELALGCPEGFDAIGARIGDLVKPEPPRSFRDLIEKVRLFAPLLRVVPKTGSSGACQEVVRTDDIDLTRLPMIRCWEDDGAPEAFGFPPDVNEGLDGFGSGEQWDRLHRGRYITFAGIHTIHADDRHLARPPSHNIGMYRVQLMGTRRLAMHWHMHHDGASHWRSWKRLGEPMPVAIVLGGPSVLPYAATAPLPPGISELLMAGFLHGRGMRLTRAKTVPLRVPADAEIVIEGLVSTEAGFPGWDPGDDEPLGPGACFEGPFGDHTGFYSLPDRYPIVDVTAMTHRRDAVFPATVVGLPPQEDYYLGKATERIFLPLLKTLVPDIEDYDLPMFGAFHNAAFIQIDKQYPLHARRVMHAIWGAGQMSWTKLVFVVDDVDPHDTEGVLRAVATRCDPEHDLELVRGPLDILDHAAPGLGVGWKLGFDATRRFEDERFASVESSPVDADTIERCRWVKNVLGVSSPVEGWIFVRVHAEPRRVATDLLDVVGARPAWVVLLGADVEIDDMDAALFHWCANMDPGRDLQVRDGVAVFDATPKTGGTFINGLPVRHWPRVLP